MPAVQLESALTCPFCGHHAREQMRSTLASSLRQHGLRRAARPAPGDCCVFCSFGTTPCPPRIGLPDPSAAPVRHGQAGCRSQASVGKAALSRAPWGGVPVVSEGDGVGCAAAVCGSSPALTAPAVLAAQARRGRAAMRRRECSFKAGRAPAADRTPLLLWSVGGHSGRRIPVCSRDRSRPAREPTSAYLRRGRGSMEKRRSRAEHRPSLI